MDIFFFQEEYINMQKKKYPCRYYENDVNKIIPNLWLGNLKSSNNKYFLSKNNIRIIIRLFEYFDFDLNDTNILNKIKFKKTNYGCMYYKNGITYYHFPIKDNRLCLKNLFNLFEQTNNIIVDGYRTNRKILVHCKKGHHRSAAIVAAFLIKHINISYPMAIAFINSKRRCALRRETCMGRALFKYFLKNNKINCDNIICNRHKTYFLCDCLK
jgi:protein-tyrosine phosphatase